MQKEGIDNKIYYDASKIPLDENATRVLIGGDFDDLGKPHQGHIAAIKAASNIDLLAQYSPELENILPTLAKQTQVICGVTKRTPDNMRPLRPILPYYAKIENMAGLESVSFVYPTSGNLEHDIEAYFHKLPPHIIVASETTSNLYASWRQQSWSNLRNKYGIIIVVLPKLVDTSTSQELSKFFLHSSQIRQLDLDFDQEGFFPLLYADELSVPPNPAVVEIAAQTAKRITNEDNRILEFNSGSGAFNAAMALYSPPNVLSLVRTVSEDPTNLGVSILNIKRAFLFAKKDPSVLSFSKSSGWSETRGTYDIIYADAQNNILSGLIDHVHPGSKVILKLPTDYNQALQARNLIFSYINEARITIQEQVINNNRFIILRFE